MYYILAIVNTNREDMSIAVANVKYVFVERRTAKCFCQNTYFYLSPLEVYISKEGVDNDL